MQVVHDRRLARAVGAGKGDDLRVGVHRTEVDFHDLLCAPRGNAGETGKSDFQRPHVCYLLSPKRGDMKAGPTGFSMPCDGIEKPAVAGLGAACALVQNMSRVCRSSTLDEPDEPYSLTRTGVVPATGAACASVSGDVNVASRPAAICSGSSISSVASRDCNSCAPGVLVASPQMPSVCSRPTVEIPAARWRCTIAVLPSICTSFAPAACRISRMALRSTFWRCSSSPRERTRTQAPSH